MKYVSYITTPLLLAIAVAGSHSASAQSNGAFTLSNPPDFSTVDLRGSYKSAKEVREGNLCLTKNAPLEAIEHYKIAAEAWSYSSVYVGFGRAYIALGDYSQALNSYRTLFDGSTLKGEAGEANDVEVLFPFVLTLSKMGRDEEALEVCRRALQLLDNLNDSALPVSLPNLGGNGINRLVPRSTMQAIARVGMSVSGGGWISPTEQQVNYAKTAAEAQPNAAWAHFYYGRALARVSGASRTLMNQQKAKAEFDLATRLGNSSTKKEVEAFLINHPLPE